VRVKARVSGADQLLVKSLLIGPDLVPRNQQDRSPFWVKRKGNSPLPIIAVKSKLLHIRVLRGIQCIDMWASELRSELPQNLRPGQYLVLY
jgi:hypothetical protein